MLMQKWLGSFLVCILLLNSPCFAGNGQYPSDGEPIENPLLYCILTILFLGYARLYQYLLEKFQDKKVLIDNIFGSIFIIFIFSPIIIAIIMIFLK